MRIVKDYLNEEEREVVDSIDIYLRLNNLVVRNIDNVKMLEFKGLQFCQYIYEKDSLVLIVIEYVFGSSKLKYINFYYRFRSDDPMSIKIFGDVKELREFLLSII